jgi:hypothetical protein
MGWAFGVSRVPLDASPELKSSGSAFKRRGAARGNGAIPRANEAQASPDFTWISRGHPQQVEAHYGSAMPDPYEFEGALEHPAAEPGRHIHGRRPKDAPCLIACG